MSLNSRARAAILRDSLGGKAGGTMGGGGKGRGVQKTMLDRAETIDFSLPKPGFTQNSDHSRLCHEALSAVPRIPD